MITVGQILKTQRENKGLTLLDIEKKIRIREKYLKAIESENWTMFSSKIYIIGIIKNYSRVLGLDSKKILAFFRRDYERQEEVKFKKRVASSYLTSESKKMFRLFLILCFSLVFLYFGYQLKIYLTPPKISFINLEKDFFTTEKQIKLTIKIDKDSLVTILGERVYQNKEGLIDYSFPLKEGSNKLVIHVTGANGKETTLEKVFTKKSPE